MELVETLGRHCSCEFTAQGLRALVCAPHEMLISDQCAIDGLLFSRRTPFVGLFGTPQTATGAILELHTLIAIVIYALIAWLVVRGAGLMLGEGRSASVARTDNVQTRAR